MTAPLGVPGPGVRTLPPLRHEWDAEPGLGVQRIGGRFRCVMWRGCARCGQFVNVHLDFQPSLVLPQSVDGQIKGVAMQMAARLDQLICPGAPLPVGESRNGGGL